MKTLSKIMAVLLISASASMTAQTRHNTLRNPQTDQTRVCLASGDTLYYDNSSLAAVSISQTDGSVTLEQTEGGAIDTFAGSELSRIYFAKAYSGYVSKAGAASIIEARGWLESLFAEWSLPEGEESADGYAVYVRKSGSGEAFTKVDRQLVRRYPDRVRADVVGLAAGVYELKVVPTKAGEEVSGQETIVSDITVAPHSREGFAHKGWSGGVGAYTDEGTLKPGAQVVYVTAANAKTVKATLSSGTFTGIQAILTAYEKGNVSTPLAIRILGCISASDVDSFGSSAEGLQIKGRKADSELNITIEGIGTDATISGFGFLVRNTASLEMRNLGIMQCMDDGISLDTDNSHVWIHHIDVFYGRNKGGDQKKGDGAIDVKSDSKHITISYCHFWDTGKSSMCGMKSESGPNYITYHHNWFDHSDSRHARVRTMSVHLWNNYFDNVAKYGVGATTGSSVFVESNYFLATKKPMLASLQGTDAMGSGTFSGETGGMIKSYGNYLDTSARNFRYYTQRQPSTTGYDAYETEERAERVPETEVTRSGGTIYNNFDTDNNLMYTYAADRAEDVPRVVTGYLGAGRMGHGDLQHKFADNVGDDNTDSEIDTALEAKLKAYKSTLAGIFGDEDITAGNEGGDDDDDSHGGSDNQGGEVISGTILCTFDKSGNPSESMFTVVGNGSNSKGSATIDGTEYTTCLKMESSTSVTFTTQSTMIMTLYFGSTETASIIIDGTKISGTANTYSTTLPSGTHTLKKDKSVNLFGIKLTPTEE